MLRHIVESRRWRSRQCRWCIGTAALPLALILVASGVALGADDEETEESPQQSTESTVEQSSAKEKSSAENAKSPTKEQRKKKERGVALFDGKSLKGWKKTDFAGGGKVFVEDRQIVLQFGEPLTGVTYTGKKFPTSNFEITLDAMRVDGSDFFCTLTFPVGKEFCSLVVGGWGGSIVGISSYDYMDASENETTRFVKFESKKWYKIRVRVTEKKIEAWIDKKQIVDLERGEREFSVRWEVEPSRPIGISSFQTTSAIKNIRLIDLEAEKRKAEQTAKKAHAEKDAPQEKE